MALDEPSDDDEKVECDGITVIADKKIVSQYGGFNIDFRSQPWGGGGFVISPANKGATACGDCGC